MEREAETLPLLHEQDLVREVADTRPARGRGLDVVGSRACLGWRRTRRPGKLEVEGDELAAGWLELGVSVGFWEGVQQAAGNVGFAKEEPEGQRAIFCQLSATRKRAISVPDLNAGLKR